MKRTLALLMVLSVLTTSIFYTGFIGTSNIAYAQTSAAAQPAVQPTAFNWTRQSNYPSQSISTADNWSINCVQYGKMKASPAIGRDGTIYTASDKGLYAVNPDGTKKWEFPVNSIFTDMDTSPVIGADDVIYFCGGDGLYAVNSNGTLKWNYKTEFTNAPPTIDSQGVIYFGTAFSGILYAINPDGTKKWEYAAGGGYYYSSPAIGADGTIYAGTQKKSLLALNPDGTLKWGTALDWSIDSTPAIGPDGTIYVKEWYGSLWALNPDGTTKWKYPLNSLTYTSPVVGQDGTIYINDYYLRAINPNGTLKWTGWNTVLNNQSLSYISTSPAIDKDGIIYAGSQDDGIYAFNQNGSLKWVYNPSEVGFATAIESTPIIGADKTLYYGDNFGNLNFINLNKPFVYNIKLDSTEYTLKEGETHQTVVEAVYTDGSTKAVTAGIKYSSSNESVATVDSNGLVKAVSAGNSTIKAEGLNRSASAAVTVTGTTEYKVAHVKWNFNAHGMGATTKLFNNTLYVSARDDNLYALNLDGTEKWHAYVGQYPDILAISPDDGTIFVGVSDPDSQYDNIFIAYDSNGKEKWRFTPKDYISRTTIGADKKVYFETSNKVYVLDSAGTKVAQYNMGDYFDTYTVGKNGTVFYATNQYIYALDSNGNRSWTFHSWADWCNSLAVSKDGTVLYAGLEDGSIYAINTKDGKGVWSFGTGGDINEITVGADGIIYAISADKSVYALYPDGTKKWQFSGTANFTSVSFGPDGTIYAGTYDGKIYALKPDTGKERFHYQSYTALMAPEVDASSTLYFTLGSYVSAIEFKDRDIEKVVFDKSSYSVKSGNTLQTVVGAVYSDNSVTNLLSGVNFSSSNPEIASISSTGVITGVKAGTVVITAQYGKLYANANVTVTSDAVIPTLTGIRLDSASYSLMTGSTQQSVVQAVYSDNSTTSLTSGVSFVSSNPEIASVSISGVITGVKAGTTSITAQYAGFSVKADVTVLASAVIPTLTGIRLDSDSYRLSKGSEHSTVVEAVYSDNSSTIITGLAVFSSSNPGAAAVDSYGTVKGIHSGQALITAEYKGFYASAAVTVHSSSKSSSGIYSPGTEKEDTDSNTVKIFNDDVLSQNIKVADLKVSNNCITIETGTKNNVSRIEMSADTLKNITSKNPDAVFDIKSGSLEYSLEVKHLDIDSLIKEMGSDSKDVLLSFILSIDKDAKISNAARSSGAELMVNAFHFKITASDKNGKVKELKNVYQYIKNMVILDKTLDIRNICAVSYNPESDSFLFAPALISRDSSNNISVYLLKFTNGTYSIFNNFKTFSDIKTHWAKGEIEELASKLIINGKTKDYFEPDENITRAEFTALIVKALGIDEEQADSNIFNDISGKWFAGAVGAAGKLGIVTGFSDGSFKPDDNISRQEMAVIINRAIKYAGVSVKTSGIDTLLDKFTDKGDISEWARDSVAKAVESNIVLGDNNSFRPDSEATRAEAATILARLLRFINYIK